MHHLWHPGQEVCPGQRARRCLLKDCERSFTPARAQSRYCSVGCVAAARRWRQVKASRRYRSSDSGRERRREQNRRYRQRLRERACRERVSSEEAARPSQAAAAPSAAVLASAARSFADEPATREGQRPATADENSQEFPERMCDRPGCYALFVVKHEACCRRFCSPACRLALRRVLDREARYRHRRRRWRRARLTRLRQRPDTS